MHFEFVYIIFTLVDSYVSKILSTRARWGLGWYLRLTKEQIEKEEKMNLKNKQEIIEKFGANAKDTGSAEVQIAMLTKKISELTEHMKSNKKDFATKRGLLMMVGKRKRLLSFLKEKNLEGYRSLIKELGIRG